ncbi:hypothetical protein [Aeoliella sp.]|uniref:hypothetical protein n=1 Tax=Aeoliella sp. TaxID=2795800 RepID=UPI003CCB9560
MPDHDPQFDSSPKFYVGICKLCETGPLGLRVCGDCGAVLVVCDECDAAWAGAETDQPPTTTGVTTLPCPHCHSDLFEPPAHWADADEVRACGWVDVAVQRGVLELKQDGVEH